MYWISIRTLPTASQHSDSRTPVSACLDITGRSPLATAPFMGRNANVIGKCKLSIAVRVEVFQQNRTS